MSISVTVDLSTTIKLLNDSERMLWLKSLLETVQEEGTIYWMRTMVNDPKWNDQPNHEKLPA